MCVMGVGAWGELGTTRQPRTKGLERFNAGQGPGPQGRRMANWQGAWDKVFPKYAKDGEPPWRGGCGDARGEMREHRLRAVGSNLPVLPAGHPGGLCGSNWAGALGRLGESRFEQGGMGNPARGSRCPAVLAVSKSLGRVGLGSAPQPAPQPAAKRVYYSGCRCQVSSAPL